jgi:hypothetical protein
MKFKEIPDGHVFIRHYGVDGKEVFIKVNTHKSIMLERTETLQNTGGWITPATIREYDLPEIFDNGAFQSNPLDDCEDCGLACEEILDSIEGKHRTI